jgi:hypothetical protein
MALALLASGAVYVNGAPSRGGKWQLLEEFHHLEELIFT